MKNEEQKSATIDPAVHDRLMKDRELLEQFEMWPFAWDPGIMFSSHSGPTINLKTDLEWQWLRGILEELVAARETLKAQGIDHGDK